MTLRDSQLAEACPQMCFLWTDKRVLGRERNWVDFLAESQYQKDGLDAEFSLSSKQSVPSNNKEALGLWPRIRTNTGVILQFPVEFFSRKLCAVESTTIYSDLVSTATEVWWH